MSLSPPRLGHGYYEVSWNLKYLLVARLNTSSQSVGGKALSHTYMCFSVPHPELFTLAAVPLLCVVSAIKAMDR